MRLPSSVAVGLGTWFVLNPDLCNSAEPVVQPPYQAEVPRNDNRDMVARALMSDYAFVGLGYVSFDYGTLPKEFYKQRPKRVVAQFNPVRIYKGEAKDGSISIELRSDMLIVPGESVSAGVKRDQLWADLNRRRSENDAALAVLESSLARGGISSETYEQEKNRLGVVSSRISREVSELSTVSGTVSGSHMRTFFDLDGAIRPNELYLLSVNPKRDPANNEQSEVLYDLPVHSANLLWGRLRDEVITSLERLVPPTRNEAR